MLRAGSILRSGRLPLRAPQQQQLAHAPSRLQAHTLARHVGRTCAVHTSSDRQFAAPRPTSTASATSSSSSAFGVPTSSGAASASSSGGSATDSISFETLGLSGHLLSHLTALGLSFPTPIQARVLPFLAAQHAAAALPQQPTPATGRPRTPTALMVQSPTGTGKSLAFLLPIVKDTLEAEAERRKRRSAQREGVRTIIVCPTQELAIQTQSQLRALLAADPLAAADATLVGMILGGSDDPALQRSDLLTKTPAILIGTPKRLNQVLFPEYDTHSASRKDRQHREVLVDPAEDEDHLSAGTVTADGVPVVDEVEAAEWRDQGRGESHGRPDRYSAAAAAAKAAKELLQGQQNSSIVSVGPHRRALEHDADDEDEQLPDDATAQERQEFQDERDGIRTDFLPPPWSLGYAGQRFLRTPPRLARQRVRTPLKRVLVDLKYLVVDEADSVLQPMRPHASPKEWQHRHTHPRPGQILAKALLMLNSRVQLVAASATVDGLLKRLVWNLGYDTGIEMMRIAPRLGLQTQHHQAAAGNEIRRTPDMPQLGESATTHTTPTTDDMSPTAADASLSLPGSSSLASSSGSASSSLASFHECPPNLAHFLMRCPTEGSWSDGRWWSTREADQRRAELQKKRYEYFAPESERQAVHEHNMRVRHATRADAFIVDKIATLKVVLDHFRPKAPMLVVDDTQYKMGAIEQLCRDVGFRPVLLYQVLSSADPQARGQLVHDVQSGAVDLLLVQQASLRGLDFPLCDLVLLLSVVRDSFDYLHAAGRTGRMGSEGSVITLMHSSEESRWDALVHRMPMTLASAKQLTLPRAIAPGLQDRILQMYDRTRHERQARDRQLDQQLEEKMNKRVRPDPGAPKRHGGQKAESKTNQFIRKSLRVEMEREFER